METNLVDPGWSDRDLGDVYVRSQTHEDATEYVAGCYFLCNRIILYYI